MIYFENTQDSQRIQIPRAANPTAVPVPSHEYRAGDYIQISADTISVTGLTSYPGYDAISGQVASQISSSTSGMQETLVSGENIRTINGNSILGSGNLVISGGQAVSGGNNIEVTEEGVINVIGINSYPGYSGISGDVATQVEAYGYATESQIPDVSEFVTSADVKTQVEAYNYVTSGDVSTQLQTNHYTTSGDVKTQIESYDYATESQIPDVSEFVTSGAVKSQIEAYNYATEGDVTAATSGCQETLVSGQNIKTINGESILGPGNITITGGSGSTIYTAGDYINISDQNVIAVTGISSYPGYSAISGNVQSQIENTVNSDVVILVSNYAYNALFSNPQKVTIWYEDSAGNKLGDLSYDSNENRYAATGLSLPYGIYAIRATVEGTGEYTVWKNGELITTSTLENVYLADSYPNPYYVVSPGNDYSVSYPISEISVKNNDVQVAYNIGYEGQPIPIYYGSQNIVINQVSPGSQYYNIELTGITSYPGYSGISGDVATQVENYHYTTSGDVQNQITGATTGLQETLVSGTNIKTVNSNSLLGSGNLEVGDVRGNGVTGLWTGTKVQYDAITAKSNTILYFIHE